MHLCKTAIFLLTITAALTANTQQSDSIAFIDDLFKKIFAFQLKMDKMLEIMNNDAEAGAVFVIGDTGAGKSTFINFITGSPLKAMQVRKRRDFVLANDQENPPMPIGHHQKSETKQPLMFSDNSNKIWVDTPGFEDTEGYKTDILNTLLLNKLFNSVQMKKIVLVLSEDMLLSGRSQSLKQNILKVKSIFGDSFGNMTIVISKATDRCDYRQQMEFIIQNDDSLSAKQNREFLIKTLANSKIIPFYTPYYQSGEIDKDQLQQFYNDLRMNSLGIIQTQQPAKTDKAKNIFSGDNANIIKELVDSVQKYIEEQLEQLEERINQTTSSLKKEDVKTVIQALDRNLIAQRQRDLLWDTKHFTADHVSIEEEIKSVSDLKLNENFKEFARLIVKIINQTSLTLYEEQVNQIVRRLIQYSHKFSSIFEHTYFTLKDGSNQKLVWISTNFYLNKFYINLRFKFQKAMAKLTSDQKLQQQLQQKQEQLKRQLEKAQSEQKSKYQQSGYQNVRSGGFWSGVAAFVGAIIGSLLSFFI